MATETKYEQELIIDHWFRTSREQNTQRISIHDVISIIIGYAIPFEILRFHPTVRSEETVLLDDGRCAMKQENYKSNVYVVGDVDAVRSGVRVWRLKV